jgi:hypothetical protein
MEHLMRLAVVRPILCIAYILVGVCASAVAVNHPARGQNADRLTEADFGASRRHKSFTNPFSRDRADKSERDQEKLALYDGKHQERPKALAFADQLSAIAVLVGVKAEQLNAWRDYTTALQAVLGNTESHARLRKADRDDLPPAQGPFEREERLSNAIIEKADAAQKLKSAIVTLRAVLTSEQLALLASVAQIDERKLDEH